MLECQICDISESSSCMQGLVTVLVAVKLGTWSSRESNLPWSAKVMRFMIKLYIRRCFSIEPSLWPVSLLCFINMKLKCYLHCIKRQDVGKWISIEQPCSVTRVVQFLWRTTLQRNEAPFNHLKKYPHKTPGSEDIWISAHIFPLNNPDEDVFRNKPN